MKRIMGVLVISALKYFYKPIHSAILTNSVTTYTAIKIWPAGACRISHPVARTKRAVYGDPTSASPLRLAPNSREAKSKLTKPLNLIFLWYWHKQLPNDWIPVYTGMTKKGMTKNGMTKKGMTKKGMTKNKAGVIKNGISSICSLLSSLHFLLSSLHFLLPSLHFILSSPHFLLSSPRRRGSSNPKTTHAIIATLLLTFSCLFSPNIIFAASNHVNIYSWSDFIPQEIIKEFTKTTGIKVNLSEYDNNETMFAKLKATPQAGYDLIFPSAYFVTRMAQHHMLHQLDKTRLPNIKHLNPFFLNREFDHNNEFSLPYLWGTTGIVVNTKYFNPKHIKSWNDLWQPQYLNQLMLLNDMREVFSMALLSLGYPANDTNPEHIKAAYLKLKQLRPNIKLFTADTEQTIYIDEDATIGMGWSGDIVLSQLENKNLQYIYPKEGFVIWMDCIAIPKNAPNLENTYKFINFLLQPRIAAKISTIKKFASPNLTAAKMLNRDIGTNQIITPPPATLKRGHFQTDISAVLPLYERYWELLKIGD